MPTEDRGLDPRDMKAERTKATLNLIRSDKFRENIDLENISVADLTDMVDESGLADAGGVADQVLIHEKVMVWNTGDDETSNVTETGLIDPDPTPVIDYGGLQAVRNRGEEVESLADNKEILKKTAELDARIRNLERVSQLYR